MRSWASASGSRCRSTGWSTTCSRCRRFHGGPHIAGFDPGVIGARRRQEDGVDPGRLPAQPRPANRIAVKNTPNTR
jgi:hypothetical protein